MNGKKQILDPLSCLCKLGMLAFYDKGTKISITNNIISFQEPGTTQWVKRTYYGDGKNDVSILYNPLLKAVEWYIIQNKSHSRTASNADANAGAYVGSANASPAGSQVGIIPADPPAGAVDELTQIPIKNIISHAINGLDRLQSTYGEGNVALAIKFLKNNLKMSISIDFYMDRFMKFNEIDDINENDDNVINYTKIKEIWTCDKIQLISNQLDLLDKNKHDESSLEYLLKSLKSQLMDTDSKFQELVKTMNSCL